MPDDLDQYLIEAMQDERDSALNKLTQVLVHGKTPDDAAWWLCANHARFIIDHPNLAAEAKLIEMATRAGAPPKGGSWEKWFKRVRHIRPHGLLRRH